jgi:nitrile hydratase subunit beta
VTRFEPGVHVRVRSDEMPGHVRTPDYVKGKTGQIECIQGTFKNPESLAYGGSGLPERALYKVGFRQMDLWDGYAGLADDALYIDLYEHWLEPAQKEAR